MFTNKDLDKKSKKLVGGIAIVALVVAGLTSYDYNPVSSEQLERAEKEVLLPIILLRVILAFSLH